MPYQLRTGNLIIIDTDPDRLISKLNALLDKLNAPYKRIYSS
jgi:hypothetical protein